METTAQLLCDLHKSKMILESCDHSLAEIKEWIESTTYSAQPKVELIPFSSTTEWILDKESGSLRHAHSCFFSITGVVFSSKKNQQAEQPIIIQPEVGLLGFIAQKKNGLLHFLVQAKIEPGNINGAQISPTVQATESNYTKKHGGYDVPYLNIFLQSNTNERIIDYCLPEQTTRFYKKRNRHVILLLPDDYILPTYPNYKWLTLGQINHFLKQDNMVNMDARSLISCLSIYFWKLKSNASAMCSTNKTRSIEQPASLQRSSELQARFISLWELPKWKITESEIVPQEKKHFNIGMYNIVIKGREVNQWQQPLIKPYKQFIFYLFFHKSGDQSYYLVHMIDRLSFYGWEFEPTICTETTDNIDSRSIDAINSIIYAKQHAHRVVFDVVLSEEGGRFFQEQNRYVIISVNEKIRHLNMDQYFWISQEEIVEWLKRGKINVHLRTLISLLLM